MSNIAVTVVTLQRVYPNSTGDPEAVLVISDEESEIRIEIEEFIGMVDSVYQAIGLIGEEEPEALLPEPEVVPEPASRGSSRLVVKQSRIDDDI